MQFQLKQYRQEMEQELEAILGYWMKYTPDKVNGGFVGRVDHSNKIYNEAPKGSVLNSRILWTFSAAYSLTGKKVYLEIAERAYNFLTEKFMDPAYGGVFWTVDHKGKPLDDKKQVYALSFAVYGLSEFYHCSKNEDALKFALQLYNEIVLHSYDAEYGGYIEALTREWQPIQDLRLSAKDANERKSMNTHLHVLEAFANLYKVAPEVKLKNQVTELIRIFLDHIISSNTGHLILFFDDAWNPRSEMISYGHDIEAAWLIQEAAGIIRDDAISQIVSEKSLRLAGAAARGLDADGGLWYEYDAATDQLVKEKHSWPQAEAMIGFFHAWQISGDVTYLEKSINTWEFVKQHIHDKAGGEWYWGIHGDYSVMDQEDKAGIWKCPYHNSRACMELIRRIDRVSHKSTKELRSEKS